MVGNRGGQKLKSGRPSLVDEQAVERLLSFSRSYVERMLKSNELPTEVKFEAALRLVIKSIPQAIQSEVSEKKFIHIIHEIEGLDTQALRTLGESCRSRALPQGTA